MIEDFSSTLPDQRIWRLWETTLGQGSAIPASGAREQQRSKDLAAFSLDRQVLAHRLLDRLARTPKRSQRRVKSEPGPLSFARKGRQTPIYVCRCMYIHIYFRICLEPFCACIHALRDDVKGGMEGSLLLLPPLPRRIPGASKHG